MMTKKDTTVRVKDVGNPSGFMGFNDGFSLSTLNKDDYYYIGYEMMLRAFISFTRGSLALLSFFVTAQLNGGQSFPQETYQDFHVRSMSALSTLSFLVCESIPMIQLNTFDCLYSSRNSHVVERVLLMDFFFFLCVWIIFVPVIVRLLGRCVGIFFLVGRVIVGIYGFW